MAKWCPISEQMVLYLECLECEYKKECDDKKSEKKLEKHIDKRD